MDSTGRIFKWSFLMILMFMALSCAEPYPKHTPKYGGCTDEYNACRNKCPSFRDPKYPYIHQNCYQSCEYEYQSCEDK